MLFWLKLAGLFILGAAVLWMLFSASARATRKIIDKRDDDA